jgi:hypothetical protein
MPRSIDHAINILLRILDDAQLAAINQFHTAVIIVYGLQAAQNNVNKYCHELA